MAWRVSKLTDANKGKPISDEFLDKCKSITNNYERLKGRWSSEAQLLHIHSEVQEFNEALRKKTKDEALEEYADILLCTIACGNYFGFTNEMINNALIAKLSIVESRVKELKMELHGE